MMIDDLSGSQIVEFRELFYCEVGTIEVNPREIKVGLQNDQTGEDLPFRLQMAAAVLRHELQEVGAGIGNGTLRDFVQKDLDAEPETALEAYLQIAQAVMNPAPGKRLFGLVRRRPEPVNPNWKIIRIGGVEESQEKTLTITGVVSPC